MDKDLKDWLDKGAPFIPPAPTPEPDPSTTKNDPPPDQPLAPWVSGPLSVGQSVLTGAGKELANLPYVPATAIAKTISPAFAHWAGSTNENDPAEAVGRALPEALGSMFVPDLPFLAAARNAPWLIRAGSRILQDAWKGGTGGAMEAKGDPKDKARGFTTGAVTAGAAAPVTAAIPLVGAAGAHMMGGHWLGPWMTYHALHPLAHYARRIADTIPGPIGAYGEKAAQWMGYENSDDNQNQ